MNIPEKLPIKPTPLTSPTPDQPESCDGPAILLAGKGGMLATAIEQCLAQRGDHWDAPPLHTLDLTQPETIKAVIQPHHKLVINAAAWTDVDGAEKHEAQANAINGQGVAALAERCKQIDGMLVHFSTDYVFNGQASEPYRVNEPRDPVNAYGRSKALGEAAVESSGSRHLLIRASWLYAAWGNNFVRTIARLATEREELNIVDDQRGRPTWAVHLAQTTLDLVDREAVGTFHVTDGGACTWYDFGRRIVERVNPNCTVSPCTSSQFPRTAKRPAYSVLDLSQTENLLGPMPPWTEHLDKVLDDLVVA